MTSRECAAVANERESAKRDPATVGALLEGTDYIYCPICGAHAPCRPVPGGGWETFHGSARPPPREPERFASPPGKEREDP